jgi:hypothetical protein
MMMKMPWGLLYRMLRLLALALLVVAFAQALPFDLMAIVFAGDLLTYFEIATMVWLTARATRVRLALAYARAVIDRPLRRAGRALRTARRRLLTRRDDKDRPFGALLPA